MTFADISNSAEQLLTHQAQQRKVFTSALLPCKSDDITLTEITIGVWTEDQAAKFFFIFFPGLTEEDADDDKNLQRK